MCLYLSSQYNNRYKERVDIITYIFKKLLIEIQRPVVKLSVDRL